MLLTGTFFGTEYTSLTTLVADGGGGSGSSGCEYAYKRNQPHVSKSKSVERSCYIAFFVTENPTQT